MPYFVKSIRAWHQQAGSEEGRYFPITTVCDVHPAGMDVPHLNAFNMRSRNIYRCTVEAITRRRDGTLAPSVFIVACTRDSIAASVAPLHEKVMWPGHIFIFRAAMDLIHGPNTSRLVNMRGSDGEAALTIIRL